MDSFSLKSCFIFSPSLKPKISKPSDEEIQDAKLLIYYPSSEESLIKRSNMGIIEGTLHFVNQFGKSENIIDKLLFSELDKFYYIAYKVENDIYIALIIEKKEKLFSINQTISSKKKFLIYLINNFYNNFYLFHGKLSDHFFKNGKDFRNDENEYNITTAKFSDFINCYFEYFNKLSSPFIDGVLYFPFQKSQLIEKILIINEKFPHIEKTSICYNGYLIYNEIDVYSMSLLYNIFFNNINGQFRFINEPFRQPIFFMNNENDIENGKLISPFKKAFLIDNNCNCEYLLGVNNNNLFIPHIKIKNTNEEFQLSVLKLFNFTFFLFLNFSEDSKNINIYNDIKIEFQNLFNSFDDNLNNIISFETIKKNSKNFIFGYYNNDNKCFRLSRFFYHKNEIDIDKLEFIQKMFEFILRKNIQSTVTKIKGYYLYYWTSFEKKFFLLQKDNKPLEEIKIYYTEKIYQTITFI